MNISEFAHYFIQNEKDIVLDHHIDCGSHELPNTIQFVDQETPSEGGIFLCDRSTFLKVADQYPADSLFFCYRNKESEIGFSLGERGNYIDTSLPFNALYNLISNIMKQESSQDESCSRTTGFFEAILSGGKSNNVHEEMKSLPSPLLETNFLLVSKSETDFEGMKHEYISQLTRIIPGHNVGEYEGYVVAILSYDTPDIQLSNLDKNGRIIATLKKYNAYATVSSSFFYVENIPILYSLLKRALYIRMNSTKLHFDKPRISTSVDYSPFLIADLCHQYCEEHLNHDAFVYLLHPGTICLLRYDKEHDTNLAEILFYYLLNNRNVAKTAEDMYMHKNTVQNKLKKIKELTHCDYDDYKERTLLIISHVFATFGIHFFDFSIIQKQ